MKKILICLFLILFIVSSAFAGGTITIGKKKSGSSCNPDSNEVGNRTEYGGDSELSLDYMACVRAQADCTGTLGYAYAYMYSGDNGESFKVCVYNSASAGPPDSGDTALSGSTCRTITATSSSQWEQSSGKIGGSVSSGTYYYICLISGAATTMTKGTEAGFSWYGESISGSYATPPSDLTEGDGWSTISDTGVSFYVAIE
jgi:hypothetical protein